MIPYTDMYVNIVSTSCVDITTCSEMNVNPENTENVTVLSTMYDSVDIIYRGLNLPCLMYFGLIVIT